MMTEDDLAFFQTLGFDEIDIEDGLTALAVELGDGSYALLTDDEGGLPEDLKQFLIFAYYSPEGAYQWSAGFKNAHLFQEIWTQGETILQKCETVGQYAKSKEIK